MAESSDDADVVCALQFTRGNDSYEYLIAVDVAAQASMSGAGGDRPSDNKLIAKAIQYSGTKEKRLLVNDRWLDQLETAEKELFAIPEPAPPAAGAPAPAPGAAAEAAPPSLPGVKWKYFMKAFIKLFPDRSRAVMADEFMSIKQDSELSEFISEYKRLFRKANNKELVPDEVNIHHVLHFIKATPSGWDKRVRRKYPALVPMQEELMEQFHLSQKDGATPFTLQMCFDRAEEIEDKLLPKIAKMNSKIGKGKKIKFYGTHEESAPDLAAMGVNFVQEQEFLTKGDVTKMLDSHKTELRNETQATIQTAISSVRVEIVGDVKDMFSSLTKKMDKDKEEIKQAQPQQQQQQQQQQPYQHQQRRPDSYYGPTPGRNNYPRQSGGSNSRFQDRFRPQVRQAYANRRAGGNRADAAGKRACYICDKDDHSFMDCDKFHDPAFKDKKDMAFKQIRRGVNHIEHQVESSDADAVRETFDPNCQEEDQQIMHIALDTLDHMEESSFAGELVAQSALGDGVLGGKVPACISKQHQGTSHQQTAGAPHKEPSGVKGTDHCKRTATATATATAQPATATIDRSPAQQAAAVVKALMNARCSLTNQSKDGWKEWHDRNELPIPELYRTPRDTVRKSTERNEEQKRRWTLLSRLVEAQRRSYTDEVPTSGSNITAAGSDNQIVRHAPEFGVTPGGPDDQMVPASICHAPAANTEGMTVAEYARTPQYFFECVMHQLEQCYPFFSKYLPAEEVILSTATVTPDQIKQWGDSMRQRQADGVGSNSNSETPSGSGSAIQSAQPLPDDTAQDSAALANQIAQNSELINQEGAALAKLIAQNMAHPENTTSVALKELRTQILADNARSPDILNLAHPGAQRMHPCNSHDPFWPALKPSAWPGHMSSVMMGTGPTSAPVTQFIYTPRLPIPDDALCGHYPHLKEIMFETFEMNMPELLRACAVLARKVLYETTIKSMLGGMKEREEIVDAVMTPVGWAISNLTLNECKASLLWQNAMYMHQTYLAQPHHALECDCTTCIIARSELAKVKNVWHDQLWVVFEKTVQQIAATINWLQNTPHWSWSDWPNEPISLYHDWKATENIPAAAAEDESMHAAAAESEPTPVAMVAQVETETDSDELDLRAEFGSGGDCTVPYEEHFEDQEEVAQMFIQNQGHFPGHHTNGHPPHLGGAYPANFQLGPDPNFH